jgi:hypothetical protein
MTTNGIVGIIFGCMVLLLLVLVVLHCLFRKWKADKMTEDAPIGVTENSAVTSIKPVFIHD